ncbi:GtrA family protein [Streptomyces sp. NPDC002746]
MSTPRSTYSPQLLQLLRFCLVGVVNTSTFYGFYLALHPWLPYFTAYTAAFAASMVGSFFLNTYLTYRTRPTWRKFLLFPLTNLTNYMIASISVYTLVEWAQMNDKAAPLVAAATATPFTYVLSRRILLRPDQAGGHQRVEVRAGRRPPTPRWPPRMWLRPGPRRRPGSARLRR